jgi:O-antigen/teichoic acid export membrane protein
MTAPPAAAPTAERFLRSTLASYRSLVVRLVVSFGAKVVLGWLLLPEVHGLYELALRIVTIAGAVRDLGLLYHLMRDERQPYGTVLLFSLGSGVVITLVLVLGAPLAAGLDPALPEVLRVFSVWVLLDGLVGAPRTYFERQLQIGRLVGPEIARGVLVAALAVPMAAAGFGVWSLVVADLGAAALFAALVWRRAWGRMPLDFRPGLLVDLLRRSNLLFLVWIVFQLVTYVDVFIIGAHADTGTVGQYARAYMLAFLVSPIVYPRALLPALVEYRDDAGRFATTYRLATVFLMCCQVLSGYFLFANAEKVVSIFGPQWSAAAPLLRILCLVPAVDAFSELGGEVLKVRHEDRLWLFILLLNLASLVGFGVFLTRRFGAPGMAAANFLLLGNALMAWRMARVFGRDFARVLRDLAFIYLVPLPAYAAAVLAFPPASWSRLVASLAAAAAGAAVLGWRFWAPLRAFLRGEPASP